MIKGILFDKDGTLLKFDELWNEATKMVMPKFLHKIGIDADEENVSRAVKAVGNSIAAMTYRDMTKAVIEVFEIEADDKMLSLYSKQLEELYPNQRMKFGDLVSFYVPEKTVINDFSKLINYQQLVDKLDTVTTLVIVLCLASGIIIGCHFLKQFSFWKW